MGSIHDMLDALENENFEDARTALKTTLADYISGRIYLSNKELFGDDYANPNEEEFLNTDDSEY